MLGGYYGIAQDSHFSQFYRSPLTLNPALTAADCNMRGTINYRNQWNGVTLNPYNTVAASFEANLGKIAPVEGQENKKQKLGAGITFLNDRSGDGKLGFTQANLSISSHVPVGPNSILGVALMGGIGQRSINFQNLTWDSQYNGTTYDPTLNSNETFGSESFMYEDLGAGIVFSSGSGGHFSRGKDNKVKFNIGAGGYHLNRPKMSFYRTDAKRLDMKIQGHAGALLPLGKSNFDLCPQVVYTTQGKVTELNAGVLIKANLKEDGKYATKLGGASIGLGAFYRSGDAIIASLMLDFGNLGVGFNYDLGNSDLKSISGKNTNAMEFSIRFTSPNPHKEKAEN